MGFELATIASVGPGRMIGLAPDGALHLVWGEATFRIPAFDLPHLAATLDVWVATEALQELRRGYYYLCSAPNGGVQLWLNAVGLLLSREELRVLTTLVETVTRELCVSLDQQPQAALGLGYRRLQASLPSMAQQN
ncbi:MAG: hypothetical protein MI924_14405 [Chloroflexales bacterium]|nr:hypothetical protein [Chloroflexales bacterium]